jgi:hypothetical protein
MLRNLGSRFSFSSWHQKRMMLRDKFLAQTKNALILIHFTILVIQVHLGTRSSPSLGRSARLLSSFSLRSR